MGVRLNITLSKFPPQGKWLGKRTVVCFHYDAENQIGGTFVRDDEESPDGSDSPEGADPVTIIRLDDGRYVLSTECMHRGALENER